MSLQQPAVPRWQEIWQEHGGAEGLARAALEGRISDEDLSYLSAVHFLPQMLRLIWKRLEQIEGKIS